MAEPMDSRTNIKIEYEEENHKNSECLFKLDSQLSVIK